MLTYEGIPIPRDVEEQGADAILAYVAARPDEIVVLDENQKPVQRQRKTSARRATTEE